MFIDMEKNKTKACNVENSDVLKINLDAATALYTAISTDTGRFLYRGVDSKLMHAAANLLSYGVDIEYIYSKLNLKDLKSMEDLKNFKMPF